MDALPMLADVMARKMPLSGQACCVAVDAAGNIIAGTPKHVKVFSPEGTLLHDRLGGIEMGGVHVAAWPSTETTASLLWGT